MTQASLAKLVWLALVFAGVAGVAWLGRDVRELAAAGRGGGAADAPRVLSPVVQLATGRQGLADAGGHVTALDDFRRIASGSALADELLLALAEPERIVALSRHGRQRTRSSHLYGRRGELDGPADIELLRAQHVELLLVNHFGSPAELARVRESGIEVFNLGEMRGLSTLLADIDAVALLLGDRARGERLALDLQRRLRSVAADIAPAQRKRALYVSAYAGQLFGGAAHTSYHDVLRAAGLVDVAAEHYRDWPHYDPEQLLALDPELIVTSTPSRAQLCRIVGLERLRACARADGVVALDDALIGHPGLSMLDAAEALREQVYGPPRVSP